MSEPQQVVYQLHESCYKYKNGAAPAVVKGAMCEPPYFEPEEGFLTPFIGLKYPRPVVLNVFALRASDNVKKYIKGWMKVLTSIFHPIDAWFDEFSAFALSETQEFVLLPAYWPRFVREIYRLGILLGARDNVIEPICVILDQDLNYRWPLQDILSAMDKETMLKNPAKEAKRLLGLLDERWQHDDRGKWKKIKILIWLAIICSSKLKQICRKFAQEVDIEHVKLNDNDLYNCLLQNGYEYLGKNEQERTELHMKLYG